MVEKVEEKKESRTESKDFKWNYDRKTRELTDMQRRRMNILCVQETKWKGRKGRSLKAAFKLL